MKIYERLAIQRFVDLQHLAMLQSAKQELPKTGYEMAWNKFSRAQLEGLVALDFYLMEDWKRVRSHARSCLEEGEDYFLGTWKTQVQTPQGSINPQWWKPNFLWMEVFEQCLLWGTALGDWDVLRRASEFPEEDAYLSSGATPQERDILVAIAFLLRGEDKDRCRFILERVLAAPNRGARILAEALNASLQSNSDEFRHKFLAYMYHYKAEEFFKEKLIKKISIEGTFLTHWARHQGIEIEIPPAFKDHIVCLVNGG